MPTMRPARVTLSAEIITSACAPFGTCAASPSGTSAITQRPAGSPISTSASPPCCRVALGALQLAACFARLHLGVEALHFESDAALHHLVLPRQHFIGKLHFQS